VSIFFRRPPPWRAAPRGTMDDGAAAAFPVPQKVSSVKWCGALCKGDPQVVVAGSHDSDQCCLYFYDVNDIFFRPHGGCSQDRQRAQAPQEH
jgi:hypothetical protein